MSVSYGGDSITFADSSTISSGWTGFKNRIINGDMRIKQRANSSVYVTTDAGNFIDMQAFGCGASANVLYSQSSDAPAGFSNSASVTVVTADTSLSNSDFAYFQNNIEGNNIADFAWGTASATPVTLSFWAKSSLVGTYTAGLVNNALNRTYMSNFTINAQNTWEYKTITIPGDTTGTWLTNNGIGIRVRIGLAGGSSSIVTNNTWVSGNGLTTSGTVNWLATVGNTFLFTGLQLEKGSTASSFEYRPYGTELALCQRYLPTYTYSVASGTETIAWVRGGSTSSIASTQIPFQVTPRVPPTGIIVSGSYAVSGYAFSGLTFNNASLNTGSISLSGGSGMTVYYMYELQCSTAGSKILWTGCEL